MDVLNNGKLKLEQALRKLENYVGGIRVEVRFGKRLFHSLEEKEMNQLILAKDFVSYRHKQFLDLGYHTLLLLMCIIETFLIIFISMKIVEEPERPYDLDQYFFKTIVKHKGRHYCLNINTYVVREGDQSKYCFSFCIAFSK